MFRTRNPVLAALRACPVCGSVAVSSMQQEETRWVLRCGECETWRGIRAGVEVAAALAELLAADRKRIVRSLAWLRRTDVESDVRLAVRPGRGDAYDLRLVAQVRPTDD